MAMVKIEAILIGSAGTRLACGAIDRGLVRKSLARLGGPDVRIWASAEVTAWTNVARLLLG